MRSRYATVLVLMLLPAISLANEKPELEGQAGRTSYSLGYQIGGDLARQAAEVDADALLRGLRDALHGTPPSIPPQEMQTILVGVKRKIETKAREKKLQMAAQYRAEGEEFLAANAEKEGVVTLPSGLQYEVLQQGTGRSPGASDKVKVRYRSTLIDGTEFFNSFKGEGVPETLHVSGQIRGMTEALQLMREGARWQLFIPADLGFGRRGPLADRTLIYEVELISIEPGE